MRGDAWYRLFGLSGECSAGEGQVQDQDQSSHSGSPKTIRRPQASRPPAGRSCRILEESLPISGFGAFQSVCEAPPAVLRRYSVGVMPIRALNARLNAPMEP